MECFTCFTSSSNCTACSHVTRNLVGNSCPCKNGFYETGVPQCPGKKKINK